MCHVCKQGGNQLDLYQKYLGLPLHAAMLDLCEKLGIPVPELTRSGRPKLGEAALGTEKRSP
jgi:DNA primase